MKVFYIFFAGVIIVISLTALCSCNRKLHTERNENHHIDDSGHIIDSLNQVIKTWSDSYEELLKTTNSTGVVFESIPCDSAKVGGSGMPHILIKPDGTKEFSGPIKSYKDDATKLQHTIFSMQGTIDSLNRLQKKDTTHHEASAVVVVRNVKTSFTPLWVWLALGAAIFFWINERFNVFKIPFLTKK